MMLTRSQSLSLNIFVMKIEDLFMMGWGGHIFPGLEDMPKDFSLSGLNMNQLAYNLNCLNSSRVLLSHKELKVIQHLKLSVNSLSILKNTLKNLK